MAKIIDVIYRVKDEASGSLRSIGSQTEGLGGSLQSAIVPAAALAASFVVVGKTIGDLIENYQDYVTEIGNFALATGVSTEEASGLIDIAGDLGISVGTLETAFKTMAKNGFEPSVAGLIGVKTYLEGIEDPTIRMQEGTRILGKAYIELAPLLNTSATELGNLTEGMSDAMLVTEEEAEATRKVSIAMEQWNDTVDTVRLTLGDFAVTALLPVITYVNQAITVFGLATQSWHNYSTAVRIAIDNVIDIIDVFNILEGKSGAQPNLPPNSTPAPATSTGSNSSNSRTYYPGGFAHGGEFTVGGGGGADSSLVQFWATPGEKVQVGDSNGALLSEIRGMRVELGRLTRTLPTVMRDAVERIL